MTFQHTWAIGVTTVEERIHTTLPATLDSLAAAGFDKPHLFMDNPDDGCPSVHDYLVTFRTPRIRAYGNWLLGIMELVIRQPRAHYYAMFQDDLVCYRNLRYYLEKCRYPREGYWNLYTFPENQLLVPPDPKQPDRAAVGWFRSNQKGRGAVGLVFSQDVVQKLLSSRHLYSRLRDPQRGWQSIDGAVVTALAQQGIIEFIHSPSLVQHTGELSVMHQDSLTHPDYKANPEWQPHKEGQPSAPLFHGPNFDALNLLQAKITP